MNTIFLLLLIFPFPINLISFNSSMILGEDYKLEIYEHPKCDLHYCSEVSDSTYNGCKQFNEYWESAKDKYGLTEDEAISICMFTLNSAKISYVLSKGNSGIFGCYLDYFINAYNKIWLYSKIYETNYETTLYHGAMLDLAKSYKLIDGSQCLLKKGEYITFTSYTSTTTSYEVAENFADNDENGGIIITIKTLEKKTKGIYIESLSGLKGEKEYIFPPGSKFEVVSDCKRKFSALFRNRIRYEVTVNEIEELEYLDDYETQTIDPNENKINKFTQLCTKCDKEAHNYCKYCEKSDKCSECFAGYRIDNNGICIKCEGNCLKCNENKCTSCLKGYGNIKGICNKCNINNCINCDGDLNKCIECKRGYRININNFGNVECLKIDTSCREYSSEGKCVKCFGGFYLDQNSKCIDCKEEKCLNCEGNICSKCIPGYGLNKGKCEICKEGCENCSGDKCITCKSGYTLNEEGTCLSCNPYCKECKIENNELKCLTCFGGYYLNNNNCNRCGSSNYCIECKDQFDVCSSCLPGTVLNANKICESCDDGCRECMFNQENKKECLYCQNGYYMDSNKNCLKCKNGCARCNGYEKCEECKMFSYYMNSNEECQSCNELINNCKSCDYNEKNQLKCTRCEKSYVLTNGTCEICEKENCDFCEIENEGRRNCLQCQDETNLIMFGQEKYGIKEGSCLECGTLNCKECIKNEESNVIECKGKSNSGSYEFFKLKKLMTFLLMI